MKVNEIAENISHTAKRIHDIERKHKVKPGTDEWFKLWFSLPYLKESADEVYDILDNVECGPFDGGCVLVAQALQQIHGGDIVVLVNDKGIADHAAVKVGNNLIDFDGALPVKQFVKRFEDNEHTNIKSIRPIQKGDLPEAPRDEELVPQLVNALTESTLSEGYKIQLERDPNMYVLHILDTKTGKRTEVRGKSGYESGNYDPEDPLHQLLDKIGKASNISELINGEVTGINVRHPDGERATAAADKAFNEDVSVPENIFHMKNRLLKVKTITDAMGNRPIMFRSFVYDAEPVAKIIKKVTNDTGRKVKTGSNQKQQEVLQKLGIENPTFAAIASGKHANVNRNSLEDMEVSGMQNIFIPMSNEIYYSDAVEDLGMGRSTGGDNISLQSDFDVDKAVASYKKGWPPAGFDNEIIVDTNEYYLLNLRSFLLELTSPEIKSQIARLKNMYDKSYDRKAEENHINDILKDLFKTKITTYGDISRWIESVAVPFVDILAANRGEPTKNTYTAYDDDDDSWLDSLDDIGKPGFAENFADGKVKGKSRPGRVKRAGASCKGSVSELRRKAKKYSGERGKMYHWCANMKGGKK